jgi:hypothetical protein
MPIRNLSIALFIVIASTLLTHGCEESTKGIIEEEELGYKYVDEHITDLKCDANISCPEELSCWSIRGLEGSPRCVDPNPEEWYCPEGTQPTVFESYPPQLGCYVCDEQGSCTPID